MVIPSTPGLPLFWRTRFHDLTRFPRSLQISEFPTGDFGSNRQAVSVETDRPFRSKSAPRCGWGLVPTLANRRCVIHPILLWSAKASTLVIIIVSSDCRGRFVNCVNSVDKCFKLFI